jgi:hypothetical protein
LLPCLSYNQTYTHGAFSFESALLDGLLQLSESSNQNILVGSADEITHTSHTLVNRFGILKKENVNSLEIFNLKTKGGLLGEGSGWFVLSNQSKKEKIKVDAVATFFQPANMESAIRNFLSKNQTTNVDFVLSGKSGDVKLDRGIAVTVNNVFPTSDSGVFKHLCGEYFTSSSFALWLAHTILKNGNVPSAVLEQGSMLSPQNILIYNRYLQDHHSLILVSKE